MKTQFTRTVAVVTVELTLCLFLAACSADISARRGTGHFANLLFPIALDLNSSVKRIYRIFGPPATFFIDAQGVIRWSYVSPVGINPGAGGILEALETLDGKGAT